MFLMKKNMSLGLLYSFPRMCDVGLFIQTSGNNLFIFPRISYNNLSPGSHTFVLQTFI